MTLRVLLVILALAVPSGAMAQKGVLLAQSQSEDVQPPTGGASVSSQIEAQRDTPTRDGGGPAVDAEGNRADDPTANVILLQRAATQRQDDLREGSEKYFLMLLEANKEMDSLRFDMAKELRAAETRRVDELALAENQRRDDLSVAEQKRIDAIRAVDVAAVQNTSDRATETANVLAQQLAQAREENRSLVSTTEQSLAASTRLATTELSNRITALEQQQYLGQGRQALSEPASADMAAQIRAITEALNTRTGEDTGSAATWAIVGLLAFLALAVLGGLGTVVTIMSRRPPPPVNNGNGNGYAYEDRPVRRRQTAA